MNKFYLIIFLSFVISSCSGDKLDVDVSNVDIDLKFERFEKEMFEGNTPEEMAKINQNLIEKGGELYEFYVYEMLRAGSVYDDSIGTLLSFFVNDSMMQMMMEDLETEFSDFTVVEDQLTDVFKRLKYHLPNAPQPKKIITYNGAFTFGVVSTDSVIGIGLDMYLGAQNRLVREIRFPQYMKEKMNRDYLSLDVAQSWLMTNVLGEDEGETFLSSMIYYGKLRYILKALLPKVEDHIIMRYNPEEYDFAVASEFEIWEYLIEMNWIYSIDMKVKLRFFEEAPSTVGIDGSPGRIGQFMGWQMVKQYMEANEDVTIEQLLLETNESKILKAYKPEENE
jgi:hypothetical protein